MTTNDLDLLDILLLIRDLLASSLPLETNMSGKVPDLIQAANSYIIVTYWLLGVSSFGAVVS